MEVLHVHVQPRAVLRFASVPQSNGDWVCPWIFERSAWHAKVFHVLALVQTNVWIVSWVFWYYFWVIPNHFQYYHWTSSTTFGVTFTHPVIPEVMFMGQLGSGKPISHFSGYMYIWNKPDAVKQVMIPEQKTSEEETNQGDRFGTAWSKWFSEAKEI